MNLLTPENFGDGIRGGATDGSGGKVVVRQLGYQQPQ
jgi:hypothetical protein